jgi:hypothetical protein
MNNSFTQFGNNNDIINNIAMEGYEVKINVTIFYGFTDMFGLSFENRNLFQINHL